MSGRLTVACLLLGVVAAGASAANAQDLRSAQTPSHNIFCIATPPDFSAGEPATLRCDIQQMTSRSRRLASCVEGDSGDAFELTPTGPGHLICHGDTTYDASDQVIEYGRQWRPYGFVCTSQTTGLTCVNRQGHGFSLSRAVQRTF